MKKLSIVFVAAVSLAGFGCKKKGADSGAGSGSGSSTASASGGGGDCSAAIANSMEVSKADMAQMPGVDDKMLAKMHDLAVKRCTDDKWSDDAVKCMTGAKTQTDAQGCYTKLTPEQQDAMNKGMIHLMTPPAGAGSDTGAAGSGSAAAADTGSGSAGSAAAPK